MGEKVVYKHLDQNVHCFIRAAGPLIYGVGTDCVIRV
jgi:hypothetical protein